MQLRRPIHLGRIIRWDTEQGVGIIHCQEVGAEVIAHLADFKDKELVPSIGDDVAFKLKTTKKGLHAKKIHYPNRPDKLYITTTTPHPRDQMRSAGTSMAWAVLKIIVLVAIIGAGYWAWQQYQQYQTNKALDELSKPVYSTKPKPAR